MSLDRARELIANSIRPVLFTGAGVSADSGVPTFRGAAADALWGKYDPRQLASLQGFARDPKLVYDRYTWRRSQLANVEPNPAHRAIARLQERGAEVIVANLEPGPLDTIANIVLHGRAADIVPQLL